MRRTSLRRRPRPEQQPRHTVAQPAPPTRIPTPDPGRARRHPPRSHAAAISPTHAAISHPSAEPPYQEGHGTGSRAARSPHHPHRSHAARSQIGTPLHSRHQYGRAPPPRSRPLGRRGQPRLRRDPSTTPPRPTSSAAPQPGGAVPRGPPPSREEKGPRRRRRCTGFARLRPQATAREEAGVGGTGSGG